MLMSKKENGYSRVHSRNCGNCSYKTKLFLLRHQTFPIKRCLSYWTKTYLNKKLPLLTRQTFFVKKLSQLLAQSSLILSLSYKTKLFYEKESCLIRY